SSIQSWFTPSPRHADMLTLVRLVLCDGPSSMDRGLVVWLSRPAPVGDRGPSKGASPRRGVKGPAARRKKSGARRVSATSRVQRGFRSRRPGPYEHVRWLEGAGHRCLQDSGLQVDAAPSEPRLATTRQSDKSAAWLSASVPRRLSPLERAPRSRPTL